MATEDNLLTEIEEVSQTDTFSLLDNLASNSPVAKKQDNKAPKASITDHPDDPHVEEGEDPIDEEEDVQPQRSTKGSASKETPEGASDEFKDELKIFAKNWVETGRLPKDFVIDDTITEEKIDKALYDHKVETLANERLEAIIKEKGITDEELVRLRGQNLGVDVVMYNKLKAYTELSRAKFDDLTEDNEEDIREFLTIYYTDLQIPKKKIESNVNDDLQSEDLDDTLKEASKHFAVKSNEYKAKINDIENAKIKEKEDRKKEVLSREKALLQSRTIAGFKISEEQAKFLEKALHEKNEIITLADGKSVKTSLYFKRIHEATSDPEKAFLHKVKFLLDDMPGDSPIEQASKGILKGLGETIMQKRSMGTKSGNIPMQEL